jgi:hypothetical protein
MTLFQLKQYREIITFLINDEPGVKQELSRHMRCQPAYLSRVMAGKADLSQDQILLLADFFKLDKEQTEYIVYVLLENRSGNSKSKEFFREKAEQNARKNLQLKKQLNADTKLASEFEATYYSSWIYSALHISLLNPKLDLKSFAEQCGLKWSDVILALNNLERMGLAKKDHNKWSVLHTSTHLGPDSPWLSRHHINWRMKICEKMSREDLEGLHYTSIASCSHQDRARVNQVLVDALQKCREIIKNSSDEVSFYYGCDLFDLASKA